MRPTRTQRWASLAGAVIAVASVTASIALLGDGGARPRQRPPVAAAPTVSPSATTPAPSTSPAAPAATSTNAATPPKAWPRGLQANGPTEGTAISGDGRFVAFGSRASNLVRGDTNKAMDIFVRDLSTGRTERDSVSTSGRQANDNSFLTSISADGRYVAFQSFASNLVANDTNRCVDEFANSHSGSCVDVFVRDREARRTIRVSVSSGGAQGNSNSNGGSLSADGRYIAFLSAATNLVPNDTNTTYPCADALDPYACEDAFVRDLRTGRTSRVSISSGGVQANGDSQQAVISGDGRFVLFASKATNLTPEGGNGRLKLFIRDLVDGTTADVPSPWQHEDGFEGDELGSISADGGVVVFVSEHVVYGPTGTGGTVQGLFVYDRQRGTTTPMDAHCTDCTGWGPSISADGRYVVYQKGDSDLYRYDRARDENIVVAVPVRGSHPNGTTFTGTISDDGNLVAFWADAANLIAHDTNGYSDAFVRDVRAAKTTRVSVS